MRRSLNRLADPPGLVDGPSVYGYALQNPGRYVDRRGEAVVAVGPVIAWIWGLITGGSTAVGTGASVTGVAVGAGILAIVPSTTGDGTRDNGNNVIPFPRHPTLPNDIVEDGCGDPDDNCPAEYKRLLLLYEVLTEGMGPGVSVHPSGLQGYVRQAKEYNRLCVPKGYQALPTSFFR